MVFDLTGLNHTVHVTVSLASEMLLSLGSLASDPVAFVDHLL